LLVAPEFRRLGLLIEFRQTRALGIEVKDTSGFLRFSGAIRSE
jgi:hypothetical protein